MTFWQHRGGPLSGPKKQSISKPPPPYAREKVKNLAPSKRIRLRRGPGTLKKGKKEVGKSGTKWGKGKNGVGPVPGPSGALIWFYILAIVCYVIYFGITFFIYLFKQ